MNGRDRGIGGFALVAAFFLLQSADGHSYGSLTERSALAAARAEVQRQASALAAERSRMLPGPARYALDLRVTELKRQGWMRELEIRAQFARERGDLESAHKAERLLEQVREPFVPPTVAAPQTLDKGSAARGGRP